MKHINTKILPLSPGVYLFKDDTGHIVYIGKATSLRTRVQSYLQDSKDDLKLKTLQEVVCDVSVIATPTETEAALLEAQLIQEHQPKFNILLKDGQPFVYLLFSEGILPTLKIVRNRKAKGHYFGPFLNKSNARSVYEYLATTFRLKLCKSKVPHGCLDYHLDVCAGSCRDDFDKDDYITRLDLARDALQGDAEQFRQTLQHQIQRHNEALEFEKSQKLNTYLQDSTTIFAVLETKYHERTYRYATTCATAPTAKLVEQETTAEHLQTLLDLPKPPLTIDCFDISHFQSAFLVGSCVRFTNGIPDKNRFRRFKIKTLTQQNDYAALQEIVRRRYKHDDLPDLILIDGGKGQLNAILQLNIPRPCISLAKREERLFSEKYPEGKLLDIHEQTGKLLIALRDYAHHFAITYHRLRRNKS